MGNTLTYRLMNIGDIDQVLEVEHLSFSLPWSREAFMNELLNNKHAVYLVLEEQDRIIGYCGAWVVLDEAHITNIAILPQFRGRKLGEALLVKMIQTVRNMGSLTVTLEVRVSNIAAQSLYRKLGFQNGGIRKSYYTDNYEDALVMWVNLR
ncbi:ribosomal protein S18-alanine N-acetyltransferase [Peribacillus deserti]|uniref:[Ribosomal protein bS18]-alanine N-acetyltransferase n=1 Tax=Peribacillus deserti TaxID=673318 RepID=A0A2N5MAP5_9BACI|nr:ribosomal protein S18-alanine N-acetyltransferase [Peribacillus deserti]PLT31432.1 ribosomal-protein-alanine N-acetyltransferase [Peribacillus deserti]